MKNSSLTEITLSTLESLILTTNSLPMEGMMLRTACGRTTCTMLCQCVMPMAQAASFWPLGTLMMPPRTISAMYAPVLTDTISTAATSTGMRRPICMLP